MADTPAGARGDGRAMTGDDSRIDADAVAGQVRRFFVSGAGATERLIVRGDAAHRMLRVLRLRPGDTVEVFDGSGRSWPATIAAADRVAVQLALGGVRRHPPAPRTVLCAALIRPNRFEWLVEKATELGVSAIRPVLTEHCAVRVTEIGATRLERWRRIATEAAEQCGRVTLPDLESPVSFSDALARAEGRTFLAAEPAHGAAPPFGQALRGIDSRPVTILIGPEGGLTAEEVRQAERADAQAVSLGPLVLRAETAALAALAILADARLAGRAAG